MDNLGTPRVVTGVDGGVKARHDYLPFGEEIGLSGGRTASQGYVVDNVRQKFTQKERDVETGLDYFGARYYGSTQGRFTTCDPVSLTKRHIVNPQKWNLYVYVLNNPLALYDPDGREDKGQSGNKVIDVFINMGSKDRSHRKGPNWNDIKAKAKERGYQVNIHQMDSITLKDISNSLKTSEVTIIVGHSIGLNEGPDKQFRAAAIEVTDGYLTPQGLQTKPVQGPNGQPMPYTDKILGPVEDSNHATGMFTCNAVPLFSGITLTGQNQTLFANNGGRDGETSAITLERASGAFVDEYTRTQGDVTSSINAAQDVVDSSNYTDPEGINRLGPYTDNDGDTFVRDPR
jgi:RHS repeat-associated protein